MDPGCPGSQFSPLLTHSRSPVCSQLLVARTVLQPECPPVREKPLPWKLLCSLITIPTCFSQWRCSMNPVCSAALGATSRAGHQLSFISSVFLKLFSQKLTNSLKKKKCGIILPTVSLKTTTVVILCVSIAYFCHFLYLEGAHFKHHFEYAQFIIWGIRPHCCTLFLNQSPFLEGGIQSLSEVPSPPLNL